MCDFTPSIVLRPIDVTDFQKIFGSPRFGNKSDSLIN